MRNFSPPLVSVIIPTLNEADRLGFLLEDLAKQTLQADEIIIIDGGSTDSTRVVALSRPELPIRVLTNPRQRVPHGLNVGLASAKGEIIVRIDAHAQVNQQYIELIVSHFRINPSLGGVGGVKLAKAETQTGCVIANVLSSPAAVGGSMYHYATEPTYVDHIPFGAYRRSTLLEVGGWDEDITVNQDYELDYRIRQTGKELLLDPAAVITWHSRETVKQLFHQYHRYGQGKAAVLRKHPKSAKPRHLLPAALVATLSLATVLGAVTPWNFLLLIPAMYLAIVLALTTRMWVHGVKEHLTAAGALIAMHIGYGTGFIKNLFVSMFSMKQDISQSQTSELSRN